MKWDLARCVCRCETASVTGLWSCWCLKDTEGTEDRKAKQVTDTMVRTVAEKNKPAGSKGFVRQCWLHCSFKNSNLIYHFLKIHKWIDFTPDYLYISSRGGWVSAISVSGGPNSKLCEVYSSATPALLTEFFFQTTENTKGHRSSSSPGVKDKKCAHRRSA